MKLIEKNSAKFDYMERLKQKRKFEHKNKETIVNDFRVID